jgi:hypothetical protein
MMNTKKSILPVTSSFVLAALFLPAFSQASPLVSIGDNTDVFFTGSSSWQWTSNLFRDETDEVKDLIWTVSPGFEVNIGRGVSNADLSIITRYDFVSYDDNDRLDTETLHVRAVGSYRSSRLDLNGSLAFDENQTTSGSQNVTGDLIESETLSANLNGEYRVSPKFSFGSGFNYRETSYTSFEDRFADSDSYTVPFDIFYELTPKVDLSVGYSYTHTEIDDSVVSLGDTSSETDAHFFNVGARGNLLPKLSGFFKVGYRTLERSGGISSSDSLGLNSSFTWTATPKVTATLNLSRDYAVSGIGTTTTGSTTTVNSTARVSATYSISPYWSASANASYTLREYEDLAGSPDDNQYGYGLSLSYSPNQYWRFSGGYDYSENDSGRPDGSDYEVHNLNLSASLRY